MVLAGCARSIEPGTMATPAQYGKVTSTEMALRDLPTPTRPIPIAVYSITDQTGQFKPSDTGQTLSRAVSQGATPILIKSLQDAGKHKWFMVVEREGLKNLLNERSIIREMRQRYMGEQDIDPNVLPAMLFAGVIIEGGIIGYDTNTVTGGLGARYLGIGGQMDYRQDTVTVSLRAVSVRTGEVLMSVETTKTIASRGQSIGVFKYVAYKDLLEIETGYTTNEPAQLALQQAIEKAVYGLIMEGVEMNLWGFADKDAGMPYYNRYTQERDGKITAAEFEKMNADDRKNANAKAQAKKLIKLNAPVANME